MYFTGARKVSIFERCPCFGGSTATHVLLAVHICVCVMYIIAIYDSDPVLKGLVKSAIC